MKAMRDSRYVRGDVNAILNGLIREGVITSFETNFDNPLSTPFGLHVRVATDQLGADWNTPEWDERRRELQSRIIRQLEPFAPGVIVSVRATPGTAPPKPVPLSSGSITGEQSRAARRLLGWSLQNHAHRAGVSVGPIGAFERGESVPRPETLGAIVGALEAAGVEFIVDPPGVKVRNANE